MGDIRTTMNNGCLVRGNSYIKCSKQGDMLSQEFGGAYPKLDIKLVPKILTVFEPKFLTVIL